MLDELSGVLDNVPVSPVLDIVPVSPLVDVLPVPAPVVDEVPVSPETGAEVDGVVEGVVEVESIGCDCVAPSAAGVDELSVELCA
jgi:hypothetical protein